MKKSGIYQSAIIVLNLTLIMCHRLYEEMEEKNEKNLKKMEFLGGKGSSIA